MLQMEAGGAPGPQSCSTGPRQRGRQSETEVRESHGPEQTNDINAKITAIKQFLLLILVPFELVRLWNLISNDDAATNIWVV